METFTTTRMRSPVPQPRLPSMQRTGFGPGVTTTVVRMTSSVPVQKNVTLVSSTSQMRPRLMMSQNRPLVQTNGSRIMVTQLNKTPIPAQHSDLGPSA
ncbi:hypothetical protein Ciccas_012869 [Cichlidogyrus casuarinus]|uniref:Uncharacterized protein n=1 Tax=Cichlidogyrus casuarinus TaxID=1844966 RepID=A0ABD2PM47_9PLAT